MKNHGTESNSPLEKVTLGTHLYGGPQRVVPPGGSGREPLGRVPKEPPSGSRGQPPGKSSRFANPPPHSATAPQAARPPARFRKVPARHRPTPRLHHVRTCRKGAPDPKKEPGVRPPVPVTQMIDHAQSTRARRRDTDAVSGKIEPRVTKRPPTERLRGVCRF